MECRDVRRIDILEEKLRWQKRVLVGLVVAFCFNASPVMSTASKWFNQLLPSKVTSGKSLSGRFSADRNEMMSKWAEVLPPETEEGRLSKTAHAAGDVLQVSELQIVNEKGTLVGVIGYDSAGDGVMVVLNSSGKAVSGLGVDGSGHGTLSILNASERVIAAMGADESREANGWVDVRSASGSAAGFFVDEVGDAAMTVLNRDGKTVSAIGVDESGHGVLGILNASGLPIAAMVADEDGVGALGISEGKFGAFVDENGNGVAETLTKDGSVRWSSEMTSGDGTPTSSGLLGDLDGDGDVDFTDFLTFAANFGKTSG